jgi:hypothetical protein
MSVTYEQLTYEHAVREDGKTRNLYTNADGQYGVVINDEWRPRHHDPHACGCCGRAAHGDECGRGPLRIC